MFGNPLTPQEILQLAQQSVASGQFGPVLPNAYVFATPPNEFGAPAFRLFDAAYITTGIIDPNRLGTGATGAGNLYLADDGTWKPVSGGGGGAVDRIIAGTNISISPAGGTGDVTINATTLNPDPTGYGSFYSNVSQPITAINTPQAVTLGQTYEAVGTSTSGSRIYMDKAGTYQFSYVAQVASSANSQEYAEFWIKYNGVEYPNSNTKLILQPRKSSTEPSEQLMTLIISGTSLNDNDYIELFWEATSTQVSLKYDPANASYPATPSIIANIIPIGAQGRDSNLNELNDVLIATPSTGQLLRRDSDGLWKNWTPNFLTTVPTLAQVTTAGNTTTNAIIFSSSTQSNNAIINQTNTQNLIFGMSGTVVNGAYYQVFGTNWATATQRGGAEFVIDTRNSGTGGFTLFTYDGSGWTKRFKMFVSGNIGIGTTTDTGHKLRVQGTVSAVLTNATHTSQVYYNTTTGELTYGALPTPATPTLDAVTTAGNITTNGIGVGGVSVGSPERAALSVLDNKGRLQLQSNTGTVDVDFVGGLFKYIAFGNLVIGTTIDSGYKLEVVGSLRATADTYLATTSGNVGIGTTSPSDKLFVQGNSTVTGYLGVHGILYQRSSFAVLNKAAGGWLFWANRNDSEAEVAMRLDYVRSINGTAGGAVGIGTTNPTLGTLHVEGTVYSTRFELPQGADLASGVAGLRVRDNFGGMYQYNNSGPYTGHFTSYHIRNTASATMFYATSAAFGIGTQTPTYRLHVSGGNVMINNGGGGNIYGYDEYHYIKLRDGGDWITLGDYGGIRFYTGNNSTTLTEKVQIAPNGNVGIGTTTPTQQLTVANKVLIGTLDNYGDGNTKLYVHSPTSVNIVLNPNPNSADLYYRVKIGVDRSSTGSFYVDHEGSRIIESWNSGGFLKLASVVTLGNKAWTLETNGYGLQMYSPFGWSSVVRYTNAASGTTATDGAFTGITENGDFRVWTYESHPMLFGTANVERMRITSTGDIGIGTITPTDKLDVQGVVSASMGFKANNQQGINGDINVGGQIFHFEMGILTSIMP